MVYGLGLSAERVGRVVLFQQILDIAGSAELSRGFL